MRSVIKREGSSTVPSVVQKQDYYPFGKTKSIATSINNRKSGAMSSFIPIRNKLIKQIISIFIMARRCRVTSIWVCILWEVLMFWKGNWIMELGSLTLRSAGGTWLIRWRTPIFLILHIIILRIILFFLLILMEGI